MRTRSWAARRIGIRRRAASHQGMWGPTHPPPFGPSLSKPFLLLSTFPKGRELFDKLSANGERGRPKGRITGFASATPRAGVTEPRTAPYLTHPPRILDQVYWQRCRRALTQ